jgi:hypothetical protein
VLRALVNAKAACQAANRQIGRKTVMLMEDTSRSAALPGAVDTVTAPDAVLNTPAESSAVMAEEAPAGPAPVYLYLRRRGAQWRAVACLAAAVGFLWLAFDSQNFNDFQRIVAGLVAATALVFAARYLRAWFDKRPRIVIDSHGIHDTRTRFSLPWADLRRAWVIESPAGAVLALEPVAGAGPFKRTLSQRLRQQDAALGFPEVTMSLKGLAYKTEALLAAVGEHKPDAVLG